MVMCYPVAAMSKKAPVGETFNATVVVRMPESAVALADEIAAAMTLERPGFVTLRADVVRAAMLLGLDQLRAAHLQTPAPAPAPAAPRKAAKAAKAAEPSDDELRAAVLAAKEAGTTSATLANAVGWQPTNLSGWLRGARKMPDQYRAPMLAELRRLGAL